VVVVVVVIPAVGVITAIDSLFSAIFAVVL